MNLNFDVTVIIPTYNRISMLEEALQSVFSQEFDGTVEIIVIDDNSSDGTSEMITEKYPSIRLIQFQENQGAYVARNQAIQTAQGKYIANLDSDDLWEPNYLSSQLAALAGKERCFAVSNLVSWSIGKNHKHLDIQKPNLTQYTSSLHHLLIESFIITPSSAMFPRQLFEEVGFFDENLKLGADTDMYIRSLLKGYTPIFSEEFTAIRRIHNQGQMTDVKNLSRRKKSRISRIQKYYPLLKSNEQQVSLNRIYAELNQSFASQYFRKKYLGNWLLCSVKSAYHLSPLYAINNIKSDIVNTKIFKKIKGVFTS